jgi:DnaJ homolog subfamily B member 11
LYCDHDPQSVAAYEVLSDESKRRIYDRYGEEGLKQHEAQSGSSSGAGDIFERFFGRGFGFGFGQQEEEEVKGEDVVASLEVTLRDLYVGRKLEITRVKGAYKETGSGRTRQCNCRMKMVTRQLGPGMYQQFQTQVCYKAWCGFGTHTCRTLLACCMEQHVQ